VRVRHGNQRPPNAPLFSITFGVYANEAPATFISASAASAASPVSGAGNGRPGGRLSGAPEAYSAAISSGNALATSSAASINVPCAKCA
jgi:hypothetical protein